MQCMPSPQSVPSRGGLSSHLQPLSVSHTRRSQFMRALSLGHSGSVKRLWHLGVRGDHDLDGEGALDLASRHRRKPIRIEGCLASKRGKVSAWLDANSIPPS